MFEQKHIVKSFLFFILFFIFTMTNVSAGDIGTYHSYILKQLNNRAIQAYKQKDYAEGIKYAEETYKYSLTHLGNADPSTLTAINNLIRFYYLNGEDQAAEPFYQESLQIRENLIGKIIGSTMFNSETMALSYIRQGRYEEAKAVFKKDLELMEAVLGKNSPNYLNILQKLGLLSFYQGDYKEAESVFKDLLQNRKSILGYSHQDTLATQLNYTLLDIYMGNKKSALQLIKETEGLLFSQDLQDLNFTFADRISQLFIKNISDFQDIAFIFASKYPEKEYINYAVNIGMRVKQIYTEIYGVQKISIQELSKIAANDQLKDKFNNSNKSNDIGYRLIDIIQGIKNSGPYYSTGAYYNIPVNKDNLPEKSGLIEFRLLNLEGFHTGMPVTRSWIAYLQISDKGERKSLFFENLGTEDELLNILNTTDDFLSGLYLVFLSKFEEQLKGLATLYVKPDNYLDNMPFSVLRTPDGKNLSEKLNIRLAIYQ